MKNHPEFIVVGPPKTATTWLFECLKEHPGIYIPEVKQCHFFDRNYEKGTNWYGKYFEKASSNELCGDITPDYLSCDDAPERIKTVCGESVKIIVVYRNPIERTNSEYLMKLRSGRVIGGLSEAIIQDEKIIKNSLYFSNISNFKKHINKDNIYIIDYADVVARPARVLDDLCKYLGLETYVFNFTNTRVNKGGGVSRFKKIFALSTKVRKNTEKTIVGRRIVRTLRSLGLTRLWHAMVLKKHNPQTSEKLALSEIYNTYLMKDHLAFQTEYKFDN